MERGELPEGWNWYSLGDVAPIDTEPVLPKKYPAQLFNYIALENIESGTGKLIDFAPTLGAAIASNKSRFGTAHVLYGKLRPYLNKVLVPDFDGICATDIVPLRPDTERLTREYLALWLRSPDFVEYTRSKMEGAKMPRLRTPDYGSAMIAVPPLTEQRRIVARIEEFAWRVDEIRRLRGEMEFAAKQSLTGVYISIIEDAPVAPLGEVAPVTRRPVKVDPSAQYHEIGIRSFGKGTFHKPPVPGSSLIKRIYQIEPGDLLFNNVFAWEGAVAVARSEDRGRVGSHRFITCVPKEGVAKSTFLCFHFLTERGLQQLGEASPGSAGRNRTLGLKALERIKVPLPPFEKQVWFDALYMKMDEIRRSQIAMEEELDALMPSVLAKAFGGEL